MPITVFRYLKGRFVRTSPGESCEDFGKELAYFKPLLKKRTRKKIWPEFKKSVESKEMDKLLKWKFKVFMAVVMTSLALNMFLSGHPIYGTVFLLVALYQGVVYACNLWSLRKIFHEVDQELRKPKQPQPASKSAPAKTTPAKTTPQRPAATSNSQSAVGTKDHPIQSGLTPRRKPLH